MKQRLFLFILIILCSTASFSQTLYELDYHFDLKRGREDYKAFVLRYDDGTGIVRVEFTDIKTKTRNIVEMQMEEHYGEDDKGNEDTTVLIYVGYDQVQILGNIMYDPDHYVFKLSDDGFYDPDYVLSIKKDDTEDIGTLDAVRLLNQEDLTEDFVLQFFTPDDEFYQNLFTAEVRTLTNQEKQTKMFLLLVANTNDKKIGKTCVIDKDNTQATLGEMAEFMGIQFVPTVIEGNDFSKANVDKAISGLRPGPNDIVVFYYSGHGFSDTRDASTFPYMDLRDKSYQAFGGQYAMNIEAVYQKIKAKGARLNLVLSDCCNNDPSQSSNISSEAPSTRVSSIGWDKNKCLSLFINQKRSLLVTAAQKGELSAGNGADGGFFTYNFREALEKMVGIASKKANPTWDEIVADAKKGTIARANRTMCRQLDDSLKDCVQHPVAKFD